ncbi:MAG: hypothetical protein K2M87_02135, partial [Muribaculaceae bacterium]|nr:hypothetical protein [Muribaculaceae bacterium]
SAASFVFKRQTLLGVMLFELLRRERQSSVTGRVISCIFAIILGVLTGSWHEGFGVPVLASVGLLFLFFKEWRRAEVALATVGLICGIAFILLSPGFQARLDPYGNAASPWTPLRYVRLICDTLGFWIGALTIVVAGIRCSWRKLYTPGFIFWVSGGLTSVIICLCFIGGARVGWWADFCGVALMLQGLSLLWPALSRKYNALSLSIVAVFAVVTVAYWVEVDLYTVREAREYRRAIAMWRENPDESVFVEVLPKSQAPWLLGRMPQSGLENHPYFADITLRRFDENKAGFFPFPDELESMRGESGSMVADADGMRQVGDWFVMPGLPGDLVEPDLPDLADLNPEQLYKDRNFMMKYSTRSRWFATPVAVEIDLGGGWQPAMATLTGFKSPADGNYYTLVLPYLPSTLQNWLLFRLRGVKRVRIVLTRK